MNKESINGNIYKDTDVVHSSSAFATSESPLNESVGGGFSVLYSVAKKITDVSSHIDTNLFAGVSAGITLLCCFYHLYKTLKLEIVYVTVVERASITSDLKTQSFDNGFSLLTDIHRPSVSVSVGGEVIFSSLLLRRYQFALRLSSSLKPEDTGVSVTRAGRVIDASLSIEVPPGITEGHAIKNISSPVCSGGLPQLKAVMLSECCDAFLTEATGRLYFYPASESNDVPLIRYKTETMCSLEPLEDGITKRFVLSPPLKVVQCVVRSAAVANAHKLSLELSLFSELCNLEVRITVPEATVIKVASNGVGTWKVLFPSKVTWHLGHINQPHRRRENNSTAINSKDMHKAGVDSIETGDPVEDCTQRAILDIFFFHNGEVDMENDSAYKPTVTLYYILPTAISGISVKNIQAFPAMSNFSLFDCFGFENARQLEMHSNIGVNENKALKRSTKSSLIFNILKFLARPFGLIDFSNQEQNGRYANHKKNTIMKKVRYATKIDQAVNVTMEY